MIFWVPIKSDEYFVEGGIRFESIDEGKYGLGVFDP